MSQARDLLALLLSTPSQPQIPGITVPINAPTLAQSSTLKAASVTKPPPIHSVQTFNTQLVIGGKDLALRKAADLLKLAAENVEKSRARSERYWVDALKMRRGNWGLIPAPLPLGSATGRGTDKTSKDFLASFSLEECKPLRFSIASTVIQPILRQLLSSIVKEPSLVYPPLTVVQGSWSIPCDSIPASKCQSLR